MIKFFCCPLHVWILYICLHRVHCKSISEAGSLGSHGEILRKNLTDAQNEGKHHVTSESHLATEIENVQNVKVSEDVDYIPYFRSQGNDETQWYYPCEGCKVDTKDLQVGAGTKSGASDRKINLMIVPLFALIVFFIAIVIKVSYWVNDDVRREYDKHIKLAEKPMPTQVTLGMNGAVITESVVGRRLSGVGYTTISEMSIPNKQRYYPLDSVDSNVDNPRGRIDRLRQEEKWNRQFATARGRGEIRTSSLKEGKRGSQRRGSRSSTSSLREKTGRPRRNSQEGGSRKGLQDRDRGSRKGSTRRKSGCREKLKNGDISIPLNSVLQNSKKPGDCGSITSGSKVSRYLETVAQIHSSHDIHARFSGSPERNIDNANSHSLPCVSVQSNSPGATSSSGYTGSMISGTRRVPSFDFNENSPDVDPEFPLQLLIPGTKSDRERLLCLQLFQRDQPDEGYDETAKGQARNVLESFDSESPSCVPSPGVSGIGNQPVLLKSESGSLNSVLSWDNQDMFHSTAVDQLDSFENVARTSGSGAHLNLSGVLSSLPALENDSGQSSATSSLGGPDESMTRDNMNFYKLTSDAAATDNSSPESEGNNKPSKATDGPPLYVVGKNRQDSMVGGAQGDKRLREKCKIVQNGRNKENDTGFIVNLPEKDKGPKAVRHSWGAEDPLLPLNAHFPRSKSVDKEYYF